jgi:ribonuclease BN (tRNA processing enzyme)
MRLIKYLIFIVLASCGAAACADSGEKCPPERGLALQVLGSGGPIADDGRASTAYILWIDGQSRVMIDAGGGSFLRFGESGATFEALDFVGLSHFHTDHSADFPALLKSGYFADRDRPLGVAGPGPGGPFPGLNDYLRAMLEPGKGAYGYLGGYLDGTRGLVQLSPSEIGIDAGEAVSVFADGGLEIDALPVPHGIVPALGFRVRVNDTSVVFASDQNGSDPAFVEFAKDADVLVMHMPIPEGASGGALQLHAKPSRIGAIAAAAEVDTLLLSHFMARSLRDFEGNVNAVRAAFDGEIVVADDLACLRLDD